jgi:iron complex outermembrane receptor protein
VGRGFPRRPHAEPRGTGCPLLRGHPPSDIYPLPIALIANGAPDFDSEHVTSFELGHRYQAGNTFSIDTSLYYSEYPDLRGLRPNLLPPDFTSFPPHFVLDLNATNSLAGHTAGGEISLHWRPAPQLDLDASVASVRTYLHEISPGPIPDPSILGLEGNTPHEEYKLHATWRPHDRWTVDAVARHTDALTESAVPAYDGLDLRLAWQVRPDLELEFDGRDLLKAVHTEISSNFIGSGALPISRTIFFRVTYRH